jgi:glycosyltransferase involved in cell wall biosynthesis
MPPAATTASACVLATIAGEPQRDECLQSISAHTSSSVHVVTVAPSAASVNQMIAAQAPADVVVMLEPCRVSDGWLERLRAAARADTNTASASALADAQTRLAVGASERPSQSLAELAENVSQNSLVLRPRLTRAVGPCIYVRRDAIELVGPLDEELELRGALEVDFAQRCLLSGLAHVAADDVVVERLAPGSHDGTQLPSPLRERYPFLDRCTELGASAVLPRALAAARRPVARLGVTVDARGLEGELTGTRLHVLELVRALAHTDSLRLRLLVNSERTDRGTAELLRTLPATEILATGEVSGGMERSTVAHRPQQTFVSDDVRLAFTLGERVVLSQLDLIAYRNPGYFPDAKAWVACRRAIRQGLAAAARVVVFSEHTRGELVSDGLADDRRVRVIPPGLDHGALAGSSRPVAPERMRAELEHGRPFLLCLGTDFRHKNRVFALRLLAALRDRHSFDGSLVLAGTHIPHGSSQQLERAAIQEMPHLRALVVDLGSVSESDKRWLMTNAAAVVYPSTYEGFGLVPFESALSGVPCAFAPQSSLAEVLPADAAAIVPWDLARSADRVASLLGDRAIRERHVRALADAARSLTWARTAESLAAVYQEAAVAPVRDAAAVSRDASAAADEALARERDLLQAERDLIDAHDALVVQLVGEREHARGMYDDLNAEVGSGLSLIGPHGTLPEDLQRALLALSARPGLSRPLYGAAARAYAAARAVAGRTRRG